MWPSLVTAVCKLGHECVVQLLARCVGLTWHFHHGHKCRAMLTIDLCSCSTPGRPHDRRRGAQGAERRPWAERSRARSEARATALVGRQGEQDTGPEDGDYEEVGEGEAVALLMAQSGAEAASAHESDAEQGQVAAAAGLPHPPAQAHQAARSSTRTLHFVPGAAHTGGVRGRGVSGGGAAPPATAVLPLGPDAALQAVREMAQKAGSTPWWGHSREVYVWRDGRVAVHVVDPIGHGAGGIVGLGGSTVRKARVGGGFSVASRMQHTSMAAGAGKGNGGGAGGSGGAVGVGQVEEEGVGLGRIINEGAEVPPQPPPPPTPAAGDEDSGVLPWPILSARLEGGYVGRMALRAELTEAQKAAAAAAMGGGHVTSAALQDYTMTLSRAMIRDLNVGGPVGTKPMSRY